MFTVTEVLVESSSRKSVEVAEVTWTRHEVCNVRDIYEKPETNVIHDTLIL